MQLGVAQCTELYYKSYEDTKTACLGLMSSEGKAAAWPDPWEGTTGWPGRRGGWGGSCWPGRPGWGGCWQAGCRRSWRCTRVGWAGWPQGSPSSCCCTRQPAGQQSCRPRRQIHWTSLEFSQNQLCGSGSALWDTSWIRICIGRWWTAENRPKKPITYKSLQLITMTLKTTEQNLLFRADFVWFFSK